MEMQAVRKLTEQELELVAGGVFSMDRVGADSWWGSVDYSVDWSGTDDSYWGDLPGDYMGDSQSSGGGLYDTYASVDAQVDLLAKVADTMIKSDPRYQLGEIGAIIFRNSTTGQIELSPLAYSTTNGAALSYPIGQWGISGAEILGIIHSHPSSQFLPSEYGINVYPSDNRTVNGVQYIGDDWNTADSLVNTYGLDPSTFRYYIVGPDNVTREYDFTDRDVVTPGTNL